MKKIKLNKKSLDDLWKDGGRKTSTWCNYYLVEKDDSYYLIEAANWKSYIATLLLSPLIVFIALVAALHWLIEKILLIDRPVQPCVAAMQTIFTKEKVRTDTVRKEDVKMFKNC